MLWKIVGIGVVTFLVLSSSFVNGEFYEQYHNRVMLGGFILVVTLCGLLVADVLKTLRLQQEQNEVLMGTKIALVSLIELKDSYTEGHSIRVRDFATRFAAYLNLAERDIEEISLAAELHDIGKSGKCLVIYAKWQHCQNPQISNYLGEMPGLLGRPC